MACFRRTGQSRVFLWTILAAVSVGGVFPEATIAQAQKIRIAYSSRSNTVTPLYVAVDQGFFREEGLEVELIQVSPRLGAMAVMNGDVAFPTSFTSTFRAILQGVPLKRFSGAQKRGVLSGYPTRNQKRRRAQREKARDSNHTWHRQHRCGRTPPLKGVQPRSAPSDRHRRYVASSAGAHDRSRSGRVVIAAA